MRIRPESLKNLLTTHFFFIYPTPCNNNTLPCRICVVVLGFWTVKTVWIHHLKEMVSAENN